MQWSDHSLCSRTCDAMQKGRRSSSVNTCCAQLCPLHCCAESLAAPGYSTAEQAGFGHREVSQLGGKALWSIPCAHREVSGSTALLHGQLSKGGRWRRVAGQCQLVPIIASMSWLLHFKAGSSLSPILPHCSICHWKILSKFWPHPLSVFLHRTEM